jgi:hypothetical protein
MRKYVLGAFLCLLVFNVNAAIISTDWRFRSDNLITQDTDSGLERLDLTVTDGLSYYDVVALMGDGDSLQGWRYTTRAEVGGLWDAFGGDSNYYSGTSTQNNGLFDAMAPFVGDLYCEVNVCTPGDGYSYWITGDRENISFTNINWWALSNDSVDFGINPSTEDFFELSNVKFMRAVLLSVIYPQSPSRLQSGFSALVYLD